MQMGNAYKSKKEYTPDGRHLRRTECTVGSIVPWSIVALAAILVGHGMVNLPPFFWEVLKR